MTDIKNLILYYSSPRRIITIEHHLFKKSRGVLILLAFKVLVSLFLLIFAQLLLVHTGIMPDAIYKAKVPNELWRAILLVAIIAPVMEEFLFRSWLVGGKQNIALAFGTVSALLAGKIFGIEAMNIIGKLEMVVIGIAFGYSFYFLPFLKNWKVDLGERWVRILAIISSIVFGYCHLNNYIITFSTIAFSPIIVGSQIIAGLILSYARIRWGLIYGITLHVLYNGLILGVKFMHR